MHGHISLCILTNLQAARSHVRREVDDDFLVVILKRGTALVRSPVAATCEAGRVVMLALRLHHRSAQEALDLFIRVQHVASALDSCSEVVRVVRQGLGHVHRGHLVADVVELVARP